MSTDVPERIKIYHIVHADRLSSILTDGHLISDAEMQNRGFVGAMIGNDKIKRRRLEELTLSSHEGLYVGRCIPFYFCPRSVMLYIISKQNHPEVGYLGGQEPIVHLVADLRRTVGWADQNKLRWAFTSSNAGSRTFEDYSDLRDLAKINWQAIAAKDWRDSNCKEQKQAEFLVEARFPWWLVEEIGVYSLEWADKVKGILSVADYKPPLSVKGGWYY